MTGATASSEPVRRDEGAIEELVFERSGMAWTISSLYPGNHRDYWASPGFTDLTGYAADDLARDGYGILSGPLTDPDALERAVAVRRNGGSLELVLHRADGSPFWNRMSISSVDGAGPPTWVVLHEDVTNDEEDRASLISRLRRTQRRTALLAQVFDEASGITDRKESFERVLDLTIPEFADWACVFQHPSVGPPGMSIIASAGGRPDPADPNGRRQVSIGPGDFIGTLDPSSRDSILVPRITEDWLAQLISLTDYPVARYLIGASLIVAPVRGLESSYGALAQLSFGDRPYDREDFETAKVIGTRLGTVIENREWASSDTRRVETIETAVFAPPAQFPGLDVAVEVGPPLPSDPYVTWCDAFPLADDMEGFVISQVYGTGMAATENVAMQRASIRAFLWADPTPSAALSDVAELAYAVNPDPLAAGGQIATISPTEAGVTLDVASVAHLPVVVREPNWGFRSLEGTRVGSLGAADVPMFSTREELARGSVVFFLSDAALGGMSGSEADELENLIAAWKELAEDSPAEAYAEIVREHASKTMWKRRLCFVIVRVPPRK